MKFSDPGALPGRNPEIEVAEFELEYVVYDPRCSEVHHLTGLTAIVFDACDGVTERAVLAADIASELGLLAGFDPSHPPP